MGVATSHHHVEDRLRACRSALNRFLKQWNAEAVSGISHFGNWSTELRGELPARGRYPRILRFARSGEGIDVPATPELGRGQEFGLEVSWRDRDRGLMCPQNYCQ